MKLTDQLSQISVPLIRATMADVANSKVLELTAELNAEINNLEAIGFSSDRDECCGERREWLVGIERKRIEIRELNTFLAWCKVGVSLGVVQLEKPGGSEVWLRKEGGQDIPEFVIESLSSHFKNGSEITFCGISPECTVGQELTNLEGVGRLRVGTKIMVDGVQMTVCQIL